MEVRERKSRSVVFKIAMVEFNSIQCGISQPPTN